MQPIDLVPAVAMAFVAAWCFAGAAVLQHQAVRQELTATQDGRAPQTAAHRPLGLAGLRSLVRRPDWWLGLLLGAAGAGLHIGAVILAPVALVQPIGVLAIPAAVLVVSLRARRRPPVAVVVGAAACVASIAVFVFVAAPELGSPVPQLRAVIIGAAVVAVLVAGLAGWARTTSGGWRAPVGLALAGAMAFGLVAGLVKTAGVLLEQGGFRPAVVGLTALILLGLLVGGWLVHQAYAGGPPEVVLACLTVVDPIVAVVLGLVLLGEGSGLDLDTVAAMTLAGVVAAGGALTLARHHPDARRTPLEPPAVRRQHTGAHVVHEQGGTTPLGPPAVRRQHTGAHRASDRTLEGTAR